MKTLLFASTAFLAVAMNAFTEPAAAPAMPAAGPVAQEGENQTEARPMLARLTPLGGLTLGEAEIGIVAYAPGWSTIPVKAVKPGEGEKNIRRFEISGARTYLTGTAAWTFQPDGTLHGRIEMECVAPVTLRCLAVYTFVPNPPPFALGTASAADYDLPLGNGRTMHARFPDSVPYFAEDHRQWSGKWSIRFGATALDNRSYEPGERFVWDMTLSTPDGFALGEDKPVDIVEGAGWVRLDYRKDIEPGSALDLSGQGLQDAPAGKHGWLKAVGGHFEFEGLPGVEQRFYGVNLCFTANYPDHDLADRLVDRFVRCGYNTIRVHHHDGAWAAAHARRELAVSSSQLPVAGGSGAEPPSFADDIDKLDYLLARCYERGLYVTTDLYVSRPVAWRDIGIDRDGQMEKQLYKTYVGLHDGAFSNWCHWAQAFLEHVNPYTGRAYKNEPGMPLISLINEGIIGMKWGSAGKASDSVVQQAWREFSGTESNPVPNADFEEWHTRRVWERCAPFVRSLGCRALLTNDNNGPRHGDGEGATLLYDYIDSHFYVDHPQFLEQPWKLPSKCGNANPVKAGNPAIFRRGWSSAASSKPCAITEWNFSGPGRYRGMGGILTGAFAAEQAWDGLWRFAYSHSNGNLLDGQGNPGYFDCVTDPLIAASDRASVCLYLRRDAPQVESDERRVTSDERQEADVPALRLDKERGSMALVSPRTCGGFAESGRIDAGPLSFTIVDAGVRDNSSLVTRHSSLRGGYTVPATLWASSLDGQPLASSSRILLTHLTDVQGNGAKYADDRRQVLLKWGRGCLIEVGAADVELRLDGGAGATPPIVWSLDTAGHRIGEVPAEMRDGTLCFRVSTAGPDGGRIYYEIVRN